MESKRFVYISMATATLFWAGAYVAGKMAAGSFSPFTLTFFRFVLALPLIFLILRWKEGENFIPRREQLLPLFLLGVIGTLGYHFFFFLALRHTTAINSSLLGATSPLVVTLLAFFFLGEKVRLTRGIGIGISFLGVFSILTNWDWQIIGNLAFNRGDLYMVLGVLCFSTYALLSQIYMKRYALSALSTTAYTFLVAVLLSFVLGLALEEPWQEIQQARPGVWWEILYMSVFASVVGYSIQLNTIRVIGSARTALFVNLVPAFTFFLATLLLGEELRLLKVLYGGLIILGVILSSGTELKKPVSRE